MIGNSTELKNAVIFNSVQVPHYNYVGDSVLGYKSHMGAGSITSNIKSDRTVVVIKDQTKQLETGLKKIGAMLGDYVEVGCNSVLNPGTVIGRGSNIYPLSSVDQTKQLETGLKKIGAMLGDYVEVGCNSVLNPGTVIGRGSNIYPLSSVRGVIPANSIYKNRSEVAEKQ